MSLFNGLSGVVAKPKYASLDEYYWTSILVFTVD